MYKRQVMAVILPLALLGFGFNASDAPAQKARETFVYGPPTLSLGADKTVITACEDDKAPSVVALNAQATSPNGNPIDYRWTASSGRIEGDGANVSWDLTGARPGFHRAFLAIDTSSGDEACEAFSSIAVLVKCPPAPVCPKVNITCPDPVAVDQPVTFVSVISGNLGNVTPTYNWTISAGRIIEGQGTHSIKVDTSGLAGQTIQAAISVLGYPLDCSASCSIQFPVPLTCRKFDEFAGLSRNDEKARLDNFFIDLQQDPNATAHVIVHPEQSGKPGAVQTQTTNIVDYLVNSRRLDARRIVTEVGSERRDMTVELWNCPQGAKPKPAQ